jgi:anti-sigma factor ChrR (cupin superfamily)
MTDRPAAHDMTDVAILYALGSLSQTEARSFEKHLSDGCDACAFELESFENTVRALAFSAPVEEPPASARERLLERVATSGSDRTIQPGGSDDAVQFVSIRASEGQWHELMEGVLVKRLHVDPVSGMATSLVKMLPGSALPIHQHQGVEQVFVIEGDCQVAGQQLTSGDYHRAEAGSTHESTSTVHGTLFLLIAPECYEVLDAR